MPRIATIGVYEFDAPKEVLNRFDATYRVIRDHITGADDTPSAGASS